MKDLAASGKTVVWQRKDRQGILFTKHGASVGKAPEDFRMYLAEADTW